MEQVYSYNPGACMGQPCWNLASLTLCTAVSNESDKPNCTMALGWITTASLAIYLLWQQRIIYVLVEFNPGSKLWYSIHFGSEISTQKLRDHLIICYKCSDIDRFQCRSSMLDIETKSFSHLVVFDETCSVRSQILVKQLRALTHHSTAQHISYLPCKS